ncbi:MAG: hypothetical protein OIN89_09935 [Candidatus Methanoperedens sp.]|jgi:hypothetical protein|nr:hypothetical protein [Candidatus Methanoperedens sp.]PKL53006.1 MAG: hypothetical protein CVV36_09420 [Candidatus Methanoperedenaceae archaeon HGW-Methanoperedenaceae-1]
MLIIFNRFKDTENGKKIIPSELTIIPPDIKAIWDEADKKNISVEEIVETVKEGRKQVYNEEY